MSRDTLRAAKQPARRNIPAGEQRFGMDAIRRRIAALLLALVVATPSPAQAPGRDVTYTRQTLIRIPFTPSTSGRIKRVILHVSTDSGRDWQPCSEAAPTDSYFRDYTAPGDGTYWFAAQSIDNFDARNPPSLAQLVPGVKVVVDTKPPLVTLRQIDDARPGIVTVQWDVRDEHLDLGRFVVEYKVPGRTEWIRDERTQPGVTGTLSWNVDPGVQMSVRLRTADRAGNVGEAVLPVSVGGSGMSGGGSGSSVSSSGVLYLNSRTVKIPCKVSVGISGEGVFDLWYTRDGGRTWTKTPKKLDGGMPANPGDAAGTTALKTFIFEADADGTYGFTVVLRNGVGIGDPDPKSGDPPRINVEIDTVDPKLQLKVTPGVGPDMRNVTIQWIAEDRNLTDRPVTLEYADVRNGPPAEADWKPLPLLPGGQDRSGTHVWTVDRNGPFKFLIRAKATDRAKNFVTEAIKEPIIIDLDQPKVEVQQIEGGKQGAGSRE